MLSQNITTVMVALTCHYPWQGFLCLSHNHSHLFITFKDQPNSDCILNNFEACYCMKAGREIGLHKTCMNRALKGFFGWIWLVFSLFPVSLSRAKTDESFVATAKTFFSKPCRLQLTNCSEIIPVHSSLSICCWYNTVGPSMSTTKTCLQKERCKEIYKMTNKIEDWKEKSHCKRCNCTKISSHILDQTQLQDVLSYGLYSNKVQLH